MEIGRRIYYELSTGKVLVDTGERSGSVVETTVPDDFMAYMVLSERVPATVGVIQLAYSELATEFASATGYFVDVATSTIIFNTDEQLPILEIVKQRKVAELKNAESEALRTFKSSALGAEHTYLSELEDMVLLNGEYSFVKSDDFDNQPILWYTVEAGNITHTTAQFIQVYLDGRSNVQSIKYHHTSKLATVIVAKTEEDVAGIIW